MMQVAPAFPAVPLQTDQHVQNANTRSDSDRSEGQPPDGAFLPRVLLLDMTRLGETSATGQLKAALFDGWPADRLMQAYGGSRHNLGLSHAGELEGINLSFPAGRARLADAIRAFGPEAILYRPLPNAPYLHAAAMDIAAYHNAPLVTWIVDDWPSLLERENPSEFARLDRDLRLLLGRSAGALSIGPAMSAALGARYGHPFWHVANGVDRRDWISLPSRQPDGRILVKYAGGLHEHMGLTSVLDVAASVERLAADGLDIRLEIGVRPIQVDNVKEQFSAFARTSIASTEFPPSQYRRWIADADILLMGYNFDERSRAYIRYSVSNKLPECLASGVAVLAYGPQDTSTMETLAGLACTANVVKRSETALDGALHELATSAQLRADLAKRARALAFEHFDINRIRGDFVAWITAIANGPRADMIGQNATTTRAAIARLRVLADPWADVQPLREAITHEIQAALRPDLPSGADNILERFTKFRARLQRT
jgi:glycosyltransferase involved in cell wall biosynthesis